MKSFVVIGKICSWEGRVYGEFVPMGNLWRTRPKISSVSLKMGRRAGENKSFVSIARIIQKRNKNLCYLSI